MPESPPPTPGSDGSPARRRWAAALALPLVRVGRWFSHLPRAIRVGFVLVLLGGLGAGIAYSQSYLKKRTQEREVAAGWQDFADAASRGDFPDMDAALDRVLAADPDNPLATGRK